MDLKIEGKSANPNNWKIYVNGKEANNIISIKFEAEAGKMAYIELKAYANMELDLTDLEITKTREKENNDAL